MARLSGSRSNNSLRFGAFSIQILARRLCHLRDVLRCRVGYRQSHTARLVLLDTIHTLCGSGVHQATIAIAVPIREGRPPGLPTIPRFRL